MSKLLNQLKTDHINIIKLLCILENQLQLVQDGDSVEMTKEPISIIREILDYMQQYPSVCHHPREDLLIDTLIELLDQCDQDTSKKIISIKRQQENIEDLTAELYQQVEFSVESNYQGMIEQIKIYLDYYYKHVEVEESFLFPLARELFSEGDWQEIDGHLSDIHDPIFTAHEETENHFIRLHKMILEHESQQLQNIA